jgi:DNA-binding NarL/FixJ family response regulator
VIRILLADDHPVVRTGLRGMLAAEPDLDVVGEAGSGAEAVAQYLALRPDVILMDLRMPDGDGVEAIGRVMAGAGAGVAAGLGTGAGVPRIIVLTTYDTDADILRAVEAGAAGYLLKDAPTADLVRAIRAAARGETVLAPVVARRLVSRVRGPRPEALSARETEVLALVSRGLTNAQIGRALYVSEATIKTHLMRACSKLGVTGRTAAVTKAMETGALPPPGQPP